MTKKKIMGIILMATGFLEASFALGGIILWELLLYNWARSWEIASNIFYFYVIAPVVVAIALIWLGIALLQLGRSMRITERT